MLLFKPDLKHLAAQAALFRDSKLGRNPLLVDPDYN